MGNYLDKVRARALTDIAEMWSGEVGDTPIPSPIEEAFFWATISATAVHPELEIVSHMSWLQWHEFPFEHKDGDVRPSDPSWSVGDGEGAFGGYACRGFRSIEIFPQVKVGKYRADFVLRMGPERHRIIHEFAPSLLVVECDGHDYHERTKEQAARDKKRDRQMQAEGLRVFRFTGSEIARDPEACASEAIRELVRDFDARLEGLVEKMRRDR